MISRHLVCALVFLQAGIALAQDADTLARAKRDADNPLRAIIEASKLKPRQKAGEAEPAVKNVAGAAAARPATGRPAALIEASQPTRSGGSERTALLPFATEAERRKAADSPRIEPTSPPAGTQTIPPPAAAPVQPAPPAPLEVPLPGPAQALTQTPAMPPTPTKTFALAPVAASLAALELADYVEPKPPDRVLRRLQGDAEVVVHFTVNPDGSVTDASVQSSSDEALDPIALDAVRQWRYRPIAAAQAHAVQLVFRVRE